MHVDTRTGCLLKLCSIRLHLHRRVLCLHQSACEAKSHSTQQLSKCLSTTASTANEVTYTYPVKSSQIFKLATILQELDTTRRIPISTTTPATIETISFPTRSHNTEFILKCAKKMADVETPRIRNLSRNRAQRLRRTAYLERRFLQT